MINFRKDLQAGTFTQLFQRLKDDNIGHFHKEALLVFAFAVMTEEDNEALEASLRKHHGKQAVYQHRERYRRLKDHVAWLRQQLEVKNGIN